MKKMLVNVALGVAAVLLLYLCVFNIREFALLVQAGYNSSTPYFFVDIFNFVTAFIGAALCITALIFNIKNKDGK